MNHKIPLEVHKMSFSYPNGHGVRDVSFSLEQGECLCLFGKNGSGKSTILRILSTLQKPQSGGFSIFGVDGVTNRQQARKYLFPVFDENAHFEFASGQTNVDFFLRLYRSPNIDRCEQLRSELDFNLSLKTQEYSLGMKRKLYLLEAFLLKKDLLLFDEPSLGLDSETRQTVFQWMKQHTTNGGSIVFGTNRVEEAKYADRVLQVHDSTVREITSADDLLRAMLTVKIQMKDREITEHIGNIAELPALVKQYLSFGTLRHIEVIGEQESNKWTPEALQKLDRAPSFVRKMIYKTVETYAEEKGYEQITAEVVDEARRRFEKR
jgi:ABC-2 type transport system ATP-binding protein